MTPEPTLSRDSIVCRSQDQVSSDVQGEIAIMSIDKGNYYMLNEVGARFWHLVEQPTQIGEVCDRLLSEYETDAEQCEREVLRLARELVEQDLLEVVDASRG